MIHQTMMERYIPIQKQAIDIDHDNADAYSKRSTARLANGDIKGAVEDLQKAQQLLKN